MHVLQGGFSSSGGGMNGGGSGGLMEGGQEGGYGIFVRFVYFDFFRRARHDS